MIATDVGSFVAEAAKAGPGNRFLVFAGSGLSVSPPAHLPSAGEMVATAIAALARDGLGDLAHPRLAGLLPEICYEALTDSIGQSIPDVWACLEFWTDPVFTAGGFGPNLGHLAAVHLAWRSGTPIVTPNYDTMLEAAAVRLGLIPVVSVPSARGFMSRTAEAATEVRIWKVHGTAEDISTVRTTLRSISQLNAPLLSAIRTEMEDPATSVCFVGYSGRDIDLAPFMFGFEYSKPPRWLSPRFSSGHRARYLEPRVGLVTIKGQDWAEAYARSVAGNDSPGRQLGQALAVQSPVGRALRELLSDRIIAWVDGTIAAGLDNRPGRLPLARARVLAAVGANSEALSELADVIGNHVDPSTRARVELLRSSLYHETGRYRTGEISADAAIAAAKEAQLPEVAWQAVFSRDLLRRQQHLPGLHFQDRRHLRSLRTWGVLVGMVWRSIRGWWWLRRRDADHSDVTIVWHAFLEHQVRVGALLQPLVALAGERIGRRVMVRWWTRVRDRSYAVGYAHGIANSHKYLHRLGATVEGAHKSEEASALYEFLSAQTGLALYHRDSADLMVQRLREQGGSLSAAEGAAQRSEAEREYRRSIEIAREIGDPSIELKDLIQLRKLGTSTWPSSAHVGRLLDSIEGSGFRRVREALIEYLCEIRS